jgi:hypothetical protein
MRAKYMTPQRSGGEMLSFDAFNPAHLADIQYLHSHSDPWTALEQTSHAMLQMGMTNR